MFQWCMCHSEMQDRQEEDHKACSDSTHIKLTGRPAAGQITQPCTAPLPLSTPSIIHPFIFTSARWQPTQAHLPRNAQTSIRAYLHQDINVCQLSRLKSHTYGRLICLICPASSQCSSTERCFHICVYILLCKELNRAVYDVIEK